MRVLPYGEDNLEIIAEAQGLPLWRVQEVFNTIKILDPKEIYFAMADFEPLPSNSTQKIECLRKNILEAAFEIVQQDTETGWYKVKRRLNPKITL